jgi:hypothetical protein
MPLYKVAMIAQAVTGGFAVVAEFDPTYTVSQHYFTIFSGDASIYVSSLRREIDCVF